MTRRELDAMPEAELRTTAVRMGVPDAYSVPRGRLTDLVLMVQGEAAGDTPALLRAQLERLRDEVIDLRAALGRAIKDVEAVASRALWLAEAHLLTGSAHRAPTPQEVSALSDAALRHLALSLGADPGQERAALLLAVAEGMGWTEWGGPSEEGGRTPAWR